MGHHCCSTPMRLALGLSLCLMLTACGVSGGASIAQETRIAAKIYATQTASARAGRAPAALPTHVPRAVATASPAPRSTPKPSATRVPSATPKPSATPTIAPTPTDEPTPTTEPTEEPEAIVKAAKLDARKGPGQAYEVVLQFTAGQPLKIIGQQQDCAWLWVGSEDDKAGWVSGTKEAVDLRLDCDEVPLGFFQPYSGYLKHNADDGADGELTVENGLDEDAVVIIARGQESVVSAYIRAGEDFTLERIPDGTFDLYFATGSGWNGSEFFQTTERSKFDEPVPFESTATTYSSWTVTLHPVEGGQATASDVPEGDFPGAQ